MRKPDDRSDLRAGNSCDCESDGGDEDGSLVSGGGRDFPASMAPQRENASAAASATLRARIPPRSEGGGGKVLDSS